MAFQKYEKYVTRNLPPQARINGSQFVFTEKARCLYFTEMPLFVHLYFDKETGQIALEVAEQDHDTVRITVCSEGRFAKYPVAKITCPSFLKRFNLSSGHYEITQDKETGWIILTPITEGRES